MIHHKEHFQSEERFKMEIKSIHDVTYNVRTLIHIVFGEHRSKLDEKASENFIVCGSASIIAFIKKNVMSGDTTEIPEVLMKKIPNDIDLVCTPKFFPTVAFWAVHHGKANSVIKAGIEMATENHIRVFFHKRPEIGALIEIFPTWTGFGNKINKNSNGREWNLEMIKKYAFTFEGVKFMNPLHAITDKIARYRPKDKPIIQAFQTYLIDFSPEEYGLLSEFNFTKIVDRARFLKLMIDLELFHEKNLSVSRFMTVLPLTNLLYTIPKEKRKEMFPSDVYNDFMRQLEYRNSRRKK